MSLLPFTAEDLDKARALRWLLIDNDYHHSGQWLDSLIGRMYDAHCEELRGEILNRDRRLRVVADE